jgi:glycosyltransferase involved in cell wall biosynthesis
MRVGFYNHTSVVSGAEISLLLTAGHLKEASPVIFAPEGELGDRARARGIEFEAVSGYRARLTKNPILLALHLCGMVLEGWRLARLIRRRDVGLLHANSIRAGIMASLFAWFHRRPVIWHVRDMPPAGRTGVAVRWLARWTASGLVCISEAVKAGLGEGWGTNVQVIHNGVELHTFEPQEKVRLREEIRRELDTPPKAKVLVVVGQIAPWKRQEDALEAARLLQESGIDVRLWIVGAAKFREENEAYERRLRALANTGSLKGKVTFTGFREDVREICCAADALVLCSDNEPFGRVLIEAMSQGLPVVATRAGGVPEIVRHYECGLLYPVGDVIELARRCGVLLHNDTLRSALGKAAFERVNHLFSIGHTVEKLEPVYRGLLPAAPLKVALVHDYLNQMGGAERVVGVLHRMFPDAPIYTTILNPSTLLDELKDARIRTTWMQRIPGIQRRFKSFFWLFPLAVRSINLREYDLVISSSSAYAKGIKVSSRSVHVCYCHTPMRFAWDFDGYMNNVPISPLLKRISRRLMSALRQWDIRTSKSVDLFIANSGVVRERILTHYRRNASLVYPPVQLERFPECGAGRSGEDGYFLVVSRLISYKRIELAVEACTQLHRRLIVVGDGPDRIRLEKLAGPTVEFAGRLPDESVVKLMQGCEALLFPGVEDFGITPLEVNACGRPVIAYREGGALDTIRSGVNGMFFDSPSADSLAGAIRRLPLYEWDPAVIRLHAESFREERFEKELRQAVEAALQAKGRHNIIWAKEVTA